jgi:hypothetical protein
MSELDGAIIISPRDMFVPKPRLEPAIDTLISKAVGFKVYAQDPRVLRIIVSWKKNKPTDSLEPDNYLKNPEFIKDLKEALC